MFKKLLLLSVMLYGLSAVAATKLQKEMINFIDSMSGVYDSMYAPALWKKEFSEWTLAAEVTKAKDKILAKEITRKEFHKVVTEFIQSMKDYHVSVRFFATEKASLPFVVRGTQDRLFLVYVDRDKLPKSEFPFELGDELIQFGSEKAIDVVKALKATLGNNTSETDQALAEMMLTSRSASRAHTVPQGPITLTFKKAKVEVSHQLIWDYEKELIVDHGMKSAGMKSLAAKLNLEMSSQIATDLAEEAMDNNLFALGGKHSYLPNLGKRIWSSDKESHFDAYIYQNTKKELIGYIRIPKYGAGEKEAMQFKAIIKKFNELTDKLVIDQLNNPGGSVFYLYSLVSMLTDKPMATPKHYMAINQEDILDSITTLRELESVKTIDELKKALGGSDTISGYPISMNFLAFMKSYYQFKIDEFNKGKTLTSPYHLYGVDKINPHPEVNYAKPILLLINELDFSGGDFFPAIMQDNKRATIMGVRTAGAGGYVIGLDIPNQLGIGGFRYTGSLADRIDHTPIENLGVKPEIDYSLTPADYQGEFLPFKKKINEVIEKL